MIVVSIVWAIVVFSTLDDATRQATRCLLWPESLAVIAFVLAWLVKGRELVQNPASA